MAEHTIIATPEQEQGLDWNYENYSNHEIFPTKELYFQDAVSRQVLSQMVFIDERDHALALNASLETVPPENQDKVKADITAAIIANGGTIVIPTAPLDPIEIARRRATNG